MKNKFRKEKYIEQRNGTKGLSFRVHYNNYSKTFSEKDYGDAKMAFKDAIKFRDSVVDNNIYLPYKKTIYEVLIESYDILVVRQKTKENHISLFRRHIQDEINIFNFNQEFVYKKLNAMVEKYSDDTIFRVYNIFVRIDRTCLIKKYYEHSIMYSVICPKSHRLNNKPQKEPVTREELDKIIEKCEIVKDEFERQQFPLILEFLYETGCRPSEVWALTWDDISKDFILINKELGSSVTDVNVVRQTKTPLSNRRLPISPNLKKVLKKARQLSDNDLVFPTRNGTYYDTNAIGARFKKISNRAGVDFHMYSLRNRFATDLTLNHVDDRTKMELMGHTNIRMTLHYARSDDETKKKAIMNRKK